MKKFTSTMVSLTLALTFAGVVSCSEQDEQPVSQNNLDSNSSGPNRGKGRSASGQLGGDIFNSAVGDPLTLETAKQWMANYKDKNPDQVRGHFFGLDIIQQILNEEGSVGVRIYYAIDETGNKKLLVVGVDSEGNDLLPASGRTAARESGSEEFIIADYSFPCPNMCQ